MKYIVLNGYQVDLLPVEASHTEKMRIWRNSERVNQQMLTQDSISKAQQAKWFENLASKHAERHYVIQYKNTLIGACNIKSHPKAVDIGKSEAYEMGLYIGDERYSGNIIAFAPTLVLNDYCFNELGAAYLHAVVKSTNDNALRYNEKLGYKKNKISGDFVELTLTQGDYEQTSLPLKQLLSRPSKKGSNNG